ncbi:MAG: hypothetical protein H6Q68_2914 [Firmicutes bacterium]|nr:hypothetical protein [Bacillota bacterium]
MHTVQDIIDVFRKIRNYGIMLINMDIIQHCDNAEDCILILKNLCVS